MSREISKELYNYASDVLRYLYNTNKEVFKYHIEMEDFVQEGLLEITKSIDNYDNTKSSLKTYVVNVCKLFKYKMFDRYTRKKYVNKVNMTVCSIDDKVKGTDNIYVVDTLGRNDKALIDEEYKQLRKYIESRLTTLQLERVLLFETGISNEEYANRFNVTKNRASTIKYDTKQLIKKLINEYNSL